MNITQSISLTDNKLEIKNRINESDIYFGIYVLSFFILFFVLLFPYISHDLLNPSDNYIPFVLLCSIFGPFLIIFPLSFLFTSTYSFNDFENEVKLKVFNKETKFLGYRVSYRTYRLDEFEKDLLISNDLYYLTFDLFRIDSNQRFTLVAFPKRKIKNKMEMYGKDIDYWINAFAKIFTVHKELRLHSESVIRDKNMMKLRKNYEDSLQNLKTFKMLKERAEIITFLQSQKLQIEDEGIVTDVYIGFIKAERKDLKVFIGQKDLKKNKLIINVESTIVFSQSFRLTREEDLFKKMNTYTRTNYIADYTLNSLDVKETIIYIDSNDLFYELSRLCKNSELVLFSGKRLSITIELSNDPILLLNNLKIIFTILEKLDNSIVKESVESLTNFEANYHCLKCQHVLDIKGETCYNCGAPIPRCIICWKDPEPFEKIVILECCGFYAHENHLDEWLERHDKCPICGMNHPETALVSIT